jgi:hypothetical protein
MVIPEWWQQMKDILSILIILALFLSGADATLHVNYDHQCPQCDASYIPYIWKDQIAPCPNCGLLEVVGFDFIPLAAESAGSNLKNEGSYIPGGWLDNSLGDHILYILFDILEEDRKNPDIGGFDVTAKKMLSELDFGDQEYLRNHDYEIAVCVHQMLNADAAKIGGSVVPEAEEYAVYSALIEERFIVQGNRIGPIPIRDYTHYTGFENRDVPKGAIFEDLEMETWEDFRAKNLQDYPLGDLFNLSIDHMLVCENENPNATDIVGLSRVGFNSEKSQALIQIDEIRGWYISNGFFVLMTKDDGAWKIEESEMFYLGE